MLRNFLSSRHSFSFGANYFRPDTETLDEQTEAQTALLKFICIPEHYATKSFVERLPQLIAQQDSPWWLVAHIIQLQLKILNSKHFAPHYFVNLFCDEPLEVSDMLQRTISSLLFTEHPPQENEIQLIPYYKTGQQPDYRQFGTDKIFILTHKKSTDHAELYDIMDDFVSVQHQKPKPVFHSDGCQFSWVRSTSIAVPSATSKSAWLPFIRQSFCTPSIYKACGKRSAFGSQ